MIFRARDVREDGVLLAFLHQSHRHASHWCLERNARIHQRERSPANRSHRRRSVRLQNVRDHAHRIRPLLVARQHRRHRALCERAVSNLSASSPAQERNLSHRKRWEVVMQHEPLLGLALKHFQPLHVVGSSKSGGDQCLGFAAGENRAAVGSRQTRRLRSRYRGSGRRRAHRDGAFVR